ncbi:hypothetical protein [Namhaeicola litoreus]|uniref:Uncharacterized protein n=1 Tax=Namhaeicola litoreus TaxID=1052145 RepID=A0ABW3Y2R5_9FLAO
MKTLLSHCTVMILLISMSCGTSKKTAEITDPNVGNWEIVVNDTPMGTINGVINIEKVDNNYVGKLISDSGAIELQNLQIISGNMSAYFDYEGSEFNLSGSIVGEEFNGEVSGMGYSFNTTGKKQVTSESSQ